MSLRDCLNSAVDQGELSRGQADELHAYWEARYQKKRPGMSDAEAARAAVREVSEELRARATLKKRRALLTEGRRKAMVEHFTNHRTLYGNVNMTDAALAKLINNGQSGTRSVKGREMGILSMAHRDLSNAMLHFRRTAVTGGRRNKADLPDLVAALAGEQTDNATAKALASSIRTLFEDLRQRFNRAGGNIPKREDFDLPHAHDMRLIRKLGKTPAERREKWKAFARPLLDLGSMTNPHTGGPVDLDYVFDTIISNGDAHVKPTGTPNSAGSLANRHQDGRVLHFRSSKAWLAYNERFGRRDVIATIFHHVNTMARDIAAMEELGPNPDAMVEWMKNVIRHEKGKDAAGQNSLAAGGSWLDRGADYRIGSLWQALRGGDVAWHGAATFASNVRNMATSAMLGAAGSIAAFTDPFVAAAARKVAGLPVSIELHNVVKGMWKAGFDAAEKAKHAVIWDDYLHVGNDSLRFVDDMMGSEATRWMVDRSLTWNALQPMTAARKRVEATEFHSVLGGYAAKKADFGDLPEALQNTLKGFTIGAKQWRTMRRAVDAAGFLHPAGVLDATGDRELAETYAELIAQWSERSLPSSAIGAKSTLRGSSQSGSPAGEAINFGMQFMSYPLSYSARMIEATYMVAMLGNTKGERMLRGAGFVGALTLATTMGAAMDLQLRALWDGKDPEDMSDPTFWYKAMGRGGGLGLFADFASKAESRFGQSITETLPGPGMALLGDTIDLTAGTAARGWRGDDLEFGKRASDYLGRYTPVLSSHPATRLAYRRLFVDQLQWLTDPKADKSFKAKKARASHWWEPGMTGPRRTPDPSTATGER